MLLVLFWLRFPLHRPAKLPLSVSSRAKEQILTVQEHVAQSVRVAAGLQNDRETSFLQAIERIVNKGHL